MFLDWLFPIKHLPELLGGALVTLELSALAFILSLLLGTLMSIVRYTHKPRLLFPVVTAIVEIMRNTPLLCNFFFVYFGFSTIWILYLLQWPVFSMTLTFAYYSEMFVVGFQSIPKGQGKPPIAFDSLTFSVSRNIPQVIQIYSLSITNIGINCIGTSVFSIPRR